MLYDLNTLEKLEQLKTSEARVVELLKEVTRQIPEDNRSLLSLKKNISEQMNSSKIKRLKALMFSTMW